MTKKQLMKRIEELELMVATLTAAINAMKTPIYVGPIPAQPTVNPIPQPSFPLPYVGDPPYYPWGPSSIGTIGEPNGLCKGAVDASQIPGMGGIQEG